MGDKYGRYFAVAEVALMSNKKGKKLVSGCKSRVGENVKNGKNGQKEMQEICRCTAIVQLPCDKKGRNMGESIGSTKWEYIFQMCKRQRK